MSKISRTVVVDTLNSAIGIAAQNRFQNSHDNVISSDAFPSFSNLLNYLIKTDNPHVLFAWRGALQGVWSSTKSKELFEELRRSKKVFASVVDHAGIDSLTTENSIINMVDGYFVSSKELMNLYQKSFPATQPIGILRDLPNYKAIEQIREAPKPEIVKIIWVGNSLWGANNGYTDHKGYHEIIKPLFSYLRDQYGFECLVVDSSRKRIPNLDTLKLIHESRVLVQASHAEGTGMPILEALGLNTAILTTDVGIAPELNLTASNIFCRADEIESIANKIVDLIDQNCNTESQFDEYVDQAREDVIFPDELETKFSNNMIEVSSLSGFYWQLKWFRRWLLQRLSQPRTKFRKYFQG